MRTIPCCRWPRHGRTARRRCQNDRGAAATELVIVMPLLLTLVLASVHTGLWFHARHIVQAAAHEGSRGARLAGASDADGEARANQVLDDLGAQVVAHRRVSVERGLDSVSVTVTGTAPAVVPGLELDISATSTSPLEQFTPN